MGEAIITRSGGGVSIEELNSIIANFYTKDESLSLETREALGLSNNKVLDDAIQTIYQSTKYLSTMITGKIAIAQRTWTGTGKYGADYPSRIEVPGEPLAMFVATNGLSSRYYTGIMLKGASDYQIGVSTYGGVPTFGDNYISWYHASNIAYQFNTLDTLYYALVIYQQKEFDGTVTLTAKAANGWPVPGALVEGLYTATGGYVYTNENGIASGLGTSGDECTIYSTILDADNLTFTLPDIPSTGLSLEKTLSESTSGSIKFFNTSGVYPLTKTRNVTISLVGGGNGGWGGYGVSSSTKNGNGAGGSGGTGGKIYNLDITNLEANNYTLTIGSGGAGGLGGNPNSAAGKVGGGGGNTLFGSYSSWSGTVTTTVFGNSSYNIGGNGGAGGHGWSTGGNAGNNGIRAGGKGGGGASVMPSTGDDGSKGGPGGGGGGGGGGVACNDSSMRTYGYGGDGGDGGHGYFGIRIN